MPSICAIATPQAPSALGILRCSGPLSSSIFPDLKPRTATLKNYYALGDKIGTAPQTPHGKTSGSLVEDPGQAGRKTQALNYGANERVEGRDKKTIEVEPKGVLLDQVVATFYEKGKSFTGEDSLELTCHGNPFILQKILADLLARGFVLAEPGEFTRRAFTNGRIDLTQAEAIGSLIAARSERALSAAHRQLAGELGASIAGFSDKLLTLVAQVEATIDFPEEDVPAHLPAIENFSSIIENLTALRSTQRAHHLTFDGARVAIVGSPNAGKSSLFNALLGKDRALVSPIAGTTRDYIEAQTILGGHLVTLIDTAGLNPQATSVESMGIEKTRDQLSTADIVVFVIDGASSASQDFKTFDFKPFATLVVAGKSDLPNFCLPKFSPQNISGYVTPQDPAAIAVSTKTLAGIGKLKAALVEKLQALMPSADTLMVSARHAAALDEALNQLSLARDLLSKSSNAPLIAHHLRAALDYLGEILGKFDNEQVLDKLFGQFCIGK
jgi:tRNA modification GTPase